MANVGVAWSSACKRKPGMVQQRKCRRLFTKEGGMKFKGKGRPIDDAGMDSVCELLGAAEPEI